MKGNGVRNGGSAQRIRPSPSEVGSGPVPPAGQPGEGELRRAERHLQRLAEELSSALEHLERALYSSKGAGFSGRVQEIFDLTQALQRETAREFGRKVGDRLGRESLWQVTRGLDVR